MIMAVALVLLMLGTACHHDPHSYNGAPPAPMTMCVSEGGGITKPEPKGCPKNTVPVEL